jgi:hypothetical protein
MDERLIKAWNSLPLIHKNSLRYAVSITMNQSAINMVGANVRLTEEIAMSEFHHFMKLLNSEIYGKNWHRRKARHKKNGLYVIPIIHGKHEKDLGRFWNHKEYRKGKSRKERLQNIHYHCFFDNDLNSKWNNEERKMVEVRWLPEIRTLIENQWNRTTYGDGVTEVDVQDIWSHMGKHEGWNSYCTRNKKIDLDAYDIININIPIF